MKIQPANIDQVQRAADGRIVLISAEESTVAADLRRISPRFKLRWCEHGDPPYFAVYEMPEGGCPCVDPNCEHGHLVLTAMECDDRIVKRVEFIDSHGRSGYDYAKALDARREQRLKDQRDRSHETWGALGEQVAHALRKDLGLGNYRGRIFVPNQRGRG